MDGLRCFRLCPGWRCDGRNCRFMAAAAAQENLDDFVDEQQGDGSEDADQPLVPAQ